MSVLCDENQRIPSGTGWVLGVDDHCGSHDRENTNLRDYRSSGTERAELLELIFFAGNNMMYRFLSTHLSNATVVQGTSTLWLPFW